MVDTEMIPVKAGEKWGYVNTEGKFLINPQFYEAGWFVEGLAQVKNAEGKYGYINPKGELVIPYQFISASPFSEGLACVVSEGSGPKYIDPAGKIVFEMSEALEAGVFRNGLARVKNNEDKWGFVDATGKVVVNYQFDDAADFHEELCAVMKWKESDTALGYPEWGYIDTKGEYVIRPQFKNAGSFYDGLAPVSNDGDLWGFIDTKGAVVINPQFEEVSVFFNGLAAAKTGDNWGYIDEHGIYAVNPQFEIGAWAADRLIMVKAGDSWGYIDHQGNFTINPQFPDATPFTGRVAMIFTGEKWGFINMSGQYACNPQFDDVNYSGIMYEDFGVMGEVVYTDKRREIEVDSAAILEYPELSDQDSALRLLPVIVTTASSALRSAGNWTYLPLNATDDRLETWWTPAKPNSDGKGTWLKIDLGVSRDVVAVDIHNGSHYPDFPDYGDIYLKNNRLLKAKLVFSDGSAQIVTLKEIDKVQTVFIKPVTTSYVMLVPVEIAKGSVWNDLCISNFRARGK
jgi:hypothetical protein